MKHVSLDVVNSLSRDVIFTLAAFNSRFKSSFLIASFDRETELFFCYLDGGLEAGARGTAVEGWLGRVLYLTEQRRYQQGRH